MPNVSHETFMKNRAAIARTHKAYMAGQLDVLPDFRPWTARHARWFVPTVIAAIMGLLLFDFCMAVSLGKSNVPTFKGTGPAALYNSEAPVVIPQAVEIVTPRRLIKVQMP
jgi:hypothetical protein